MLMTYVAYISPHDPRILRMSEKKKIFHVNWELYWNYANRNVNC